MVYLVQHGEAKDAAEDPSRDLREEGERHSRQAGAFLRSHSLKPELVWHSGKLRAEHTAEIITEEVGRTAEVAIHEGLLPNDDPAAIVRELEALKDTDVLIVSHLPFLDRLVALMLGTTTSGVRFRNAGITALSHEDRRWVVQWMLPPQLFPKES